MSKCDPIPVTYPIITTEADFLSAQRRWEKAIEDVIVEMSCVTDVAGRPIMWGGRVHPIASSYNESIALLAKTRLI